MNKIRRVLQRIGFRGWMFAATVYPMVALIILGEVCGWNHVLDLLVFLGWILLSMAGAMLLVFIPMIIDDWLKD